MTRTADGYDVVTTLNGAALNTHTVATTSDLTLDSLWFGVNNRNSDLELSIDNLVVTAVPEPSTYAAILGLLALGVVAYRRRRSAK